MRVFKIFFFTVSLLSFLHAGIFDLIRDIFKSKPKESPKKEILENPKPNPNQEIIIENEETEEFIQKIPFARYPYSYNIAFILPKRLIGKYSLTSVNTALAYFIKRGINFKIDVYDIYNGNFEILNKTLSSLEQKNYHLIIAPVTKNMAQNICSLYIQKIIYIPTVNKNSLSCDNPNVYFGGIDYNRQFLALSKKVANKEAVLVYLDSPFIYSLNSWARNYFFIKKEIKVTNGKNLKNSILKYKRYLQNSVVLLNTPIVKSALFLSEAYLYSINSKYYLSTQINYDPHIFLLTQYKMRKNILIANSIFDTYIKYSDASKILGADIRFDKVNYAVMNGLDYFLINSYRDRGRIFKEKIYDNQIYYNIEIVSPDKGYFKKR